MQIFFIAISRIQFFVPASSARNGLYTSQVVRNKLTKFIVIIESVRHEKMHATAKRLTSAAYWIICYA